MIIYEVNLDVDDAIANEYAERMRGEAPARFEGQFEAARRVLEQRGVFTGVITEE